MAVGHGSCLALLAAASCDVGVVGHQMVLGSPALGVIRVLAGDSLKSEWWFTGPTSPAWRCWSGCCTGRVPPDGRSMSVRPDARPRWFVRADAGQSRGARLPSRMAMRPMDYTELLQQVQAAAAWTKSPPSV
jgi:hypothetical protein